MARSERGRRAGVPLLVAAVLLLTGCAGIPESGPVVVGRPVGDAPRAPLRISGAQPKAGAAPEEIVRGFLRATADLTDDRNVARMFLVGPRRDSWRADTSVVVYAGEAQLSAVTTVPGAAPSRAAPSRAAPSPAASPAAASPAAASPAAATGAVPTGALPTGAAATGAVPTATAQPSTAPVEGARVDVSVQVPVLARVDGDGEYQVSGPGDVERRSFGLVARSGQWRIDTLPDGAVLTRADFDTTYSNLPVYFPDPTGGWLVPDVRWFPVGGATATALVKAVLAGPSSWLAPAVTTGAPAGTQLTASSVPVQQGMAMVDLTGGARQADPVHRQMLREQLEDTLAVLPLISPIQVEGVTITVESKSFDIPRDAGLAASRGRPGEPSPRLLIDPVVDGSPLVVDRGRLMRLSGRQLTAVPGVSGLAGPTLAWPAIATDGSAYAGLIGGTQLVHAVAGGKAVPLVSGLGPLTVPSFDPLGWVWTAATTAGPVGTVRAGRPDRGTVTVPTSGWPAGLAVTSLRISRDGTRALVSGQRGTGGGVLFVCAVERDHTQVPMRLGPPQTVLPDLATARSAAWLDQRRVVVLGRRGSGAELPWKVEIGGDAEPAPAVPGGALGLTAANGEIYAALPDGIAQLSLTTWVRVSSARWPAMPG